MGFNLIHLANANIDNAQDTLNTLAANSLDNERPAFELAAALFRSVSFCNHQWALYQDHIQCNRCNYLERKQLPPSSL